MYINEYILCSKMLMSSWLVSIVCRFWLHYVESTCHANTFIHTFTNADTDSHSNPSKIVNYLQSNNTCIISYINFLRTLYDMCAFLIKIIELTHSTYNPSFKNEWKNLIASRYSLLRTRKIIFVPPSQK